MQGLTLGIVGWKSMRLGHVATHVHGIQHRDHKNAHAAEATDSCKAHTQSIAMTAK